MEEGRGNTVSFTGSEHSNKALFTQHLIHQGTMGIFRMLRVHIKITTKLIMFEPDSKESCI